MTALPPSTVENDEGVDHAVAPPDYAELHRRYFRYVVHLVRKNGIPDAYAEDVASDILMRFMERDFLHEFNPDLVFVYSGVEHKARFKSFLAKFVYTYCKGHRDRYVRRQQREILCLDAPAGDESAETNLDYLARKYHGFTDSPEHVVVNQLDIDVQTAKLRHYLAAVPPRSAFDTCDLTALFDVVARQVLNTGQWDINEIKDIFGISTTAAFSWLWWLRENLADFYAKPLPPKRAVRHTRHEHSSEHSSDEETDSIDRDELPGAA